jgi:hypothetical protein
MPRKFNVQKNITCLHVLFFIQAGNKPNSVLSNIYLSRKLLYAIKRTTFHPSIILGASLENMNASDGLFTLSLPKGLFLLPGKNLAVSPFDFAQGNPFQNKP